MLVNLSGLHCGKSKVLYPQAAWDRGDLDIWQRFFVPKLIDITEDDDDVQNIRYHREA